MLRPSSVSVGISALRATCANRTRGSPRPFARAAATKSASSTSSIPTRRLRTRMRHDRERGGQSGQDESLEVAAEASARPRRPAAGEVDREDLDQDDAEPERRHAEPDDRDGRGRRGRPSRSWRDAASAASGTVITTAKSVATRDQRSRLADALADQRDDRHAVDVRQSEVAAHQIADVVAELAAGASWSSPHWASSAATAAGVACSPRTARAGSPGTTCSSRNVADGDADHDDQRRRRAARGGV